MTNIPEGPPPGENPFRWIVRTAAAIRSASTAWLDLMERGHAHQRAANQKELARLEEEKRWAAGRRTGGLSAPGRNIDKRDGHHEE